MKTFPIAVTIIVLSLICCKRNSGGAESKTNDGYASVAFQMKTDWKTNRYGMIHWPENTNKYKSLVISNRSHIRFGGHGYSVVILMPVTAEEMKAITNSYPTNVSTAPLEIDILK